MKRIMRILAVVLALALAFSAAACTKTTPSDQSGANTETKEASKDNKGYAKVIYAFPSFAGAPQDKAVVEEAMNVILREKAGAEIELMPIPFMEYQEKVTLMLSGGEKLDLLTDHGTIIPYANAVGKGYYTDITDIIEEHGKGVLEAVGDQFLSAAAVNGRYYGMPTVHDIATGFGFSIRKDWLDETGIDCSNIQTMDQMTPVWEAIKKNHPDAYPLYLSGAGVLSVKANASIDVLDNFLGVLIDGTKDLTVVDWFESDMYYNDVKLFHEWYEKGYIKPEGASSTDSYYTLAQAGQVAANMQGAKPGQDAQDTASAGGLPITSVMVGHQYSSTAIAAGVMTTVPASATDPVASVKVMNELYTNPELINLLNYGIEGKHYVLTEDGQVTFPEGLDATNDPYYWSLNWAFGNEFISYTTVQQDKDVWKQTDEFNKTATISKAMGFTFDTKNVKTEITAVENVCSKYRPGLETGELDPDETLPKFIEELKTAGIDTIIAEKQKQLDAWAKENGVQ